MLKYNVVIAPTTQSITHTYASKNAASKGVRVATMPGITEKIMKDSMLADYDKVEKLTLEVLKKVKNSKNKRSR